jgi:hypothetical protein
MREFTERRTSSVICCSKPLDCLRLEKHKERSENPKGVSREVEGGQGSESKRDREGRGGPSLRTVWRRPLDRTPSTGSGGQDKKRSIKEDVGHAMKKRKEKRKEGGQPAVNNVWNEDFRCATGLYWWPYITCIVLLLRFYCFYLLIYVVCIEDNM